ncbi:MAG: U32 family peptidase [Eubacterium sp.]|nr:U32 family peptidase [Eubacterium sp.]MDD7210512.1 U32 family peptidase [Lachnospiraceae bacterium]MDY5497372.1 U32 family peptidase [Anaerobutyricum sp.]
MKILVPLNSEECLEEYIQAGADELYMGFYDEAWFEKFGRYADINRMSGFKGRANRYNFQEMLHLAQRTKQLGKSAFVTMNANCYSREQIEYVKEHYFPDLKQVGIDGLICSDIHMMREASKAGLPTVASTMCAIYNEDIARYYYEAGTRRMIVPRDLSLEEIADICRAFPDVEYEAFFMRNGCVFADCYCLGMHRKECGATCAFIRNHPKETITGRKTFDEMQEINRNDYLYDEAFHRETCGMCALYRMKEMGIRSLKIVGRSDQHKAVCEDIRLVRKNIEIANKASCEEEYLHSMIFPSNAKKKCLSGLSCYYPEVRFKKNKRS